MNLAELFQSGGYGSEFDSDAETEKRRKKDENLMSKKTKREKKAHKRLLEEEYNKEEGRIHRHHILSMDAERHKMMINNYLQYYSGSSSHFQRDTSKDRTDMDVIRENHKFLWTEDDDQDDSWEKQLARRYYEKLFREYCIADLSRYKENKFAMRWRIEREVEEGKGQFICGNKKCKEKSGLKSWEVNFAYMEHGEKRNALVKLRLCPDCSYKLNYHHKKKEILPQKKKDHSSRRESSSKKRKSSPESRKGKAHKQKGDNSEEPSTSQTEQTDDSIWSGPAKITEEKSRDEEFDEYFADMFL